jgi:hypothetical protein
MCVAARAEAMIDDTVRVEVLLDGGSEVVLMPDRTLEKLCLPIDTDINWQINAHNHSRKRGER